MHHRHFILVILLICTLVLCLSDSTAKTETGSSSFVCGDIDCDGYGPNVSDLTYLVSMLFRNGPDPSDWQSADLDGHFSVTVSDLSYLVAYLFKHGASLVVV